MDYNQRVAKWYDQNANLEDTRLQGGRLEHAVTLHYIQSTITRLQQEQGRTHLRIADIGCGTGVYALPLLAAGHELSISDISPVELDLAVTKAAAQNISFATAQALDARLLPQHPDLYQPDYYDLQLWLGPLYHILDRPARLRALLTAVEMCRAGGSIAVAFVTRAAHLRDVATRDPGRLLDEETFYHPERYLADGVYTRGEGPGMHHTTVREIRELLGDVVGRAREMGREVVVERMVSCEGFLGGRHAESLVELGEEGFERWLRVVLATAEDETTLGCADHVLVLLKRTV